MSHKAQDRADRPRARPRVRRAAVPTLGESAQYYKHVDEVMVQPDAWHGKPLQVHGYAKDVRRKRDSLEYRFEMQSNGKVVRAYYTGIVPDTFKNDSEVVLQGTLGAGRLPRDRDDGEVPVEVRAAGGRRGNASGATQLTEG